MADVKYGVIELNTVASQTNHALNKSAINMTDALSDGSVFNLKAKSAVAGDSQVWLATKPVANALTGLWMANGLVDIRTNGKYSNIDPNPQHFVNEAGLEFDAFKPQVEDVITLTTEALAGNFVANTSKFVNATADSYLLTWGNAQTAGVMSMQYLKTSYISIGDGTLGSTQRVTAYQFSVVAN